MKKIISWVIVVLVVGALVVLGIRLFGSKHVAEETTYSYDNQIEIEADEDTGPHPDGTSETYYQDGALKSVANYKNDLLDGERTIYAKDGHVIEVKSFKEGKADGITRGFYENGIIEAEIEYADGKKNGTYQRFYPTGNPRIRLTYVDDVLNGMAQWYNTEGKTAALASFKDGKIEGGHIFKYGEIKDFLHEMTEEEKKEYEGKAK